MVWDVVSLLWMAACAMSSRLRSRSCVGGVGDTVVKVLGMILAGDVTDEKTWGAQNPAGLQLSAADRCSGQMGEAHDSE